MGELFRLINPKNEEQEREYRAYMKQEGIKLPSDDFKFGRLPTYAELKQILSRLPQYTVRDVGGDIYLNFQNADYEIALRVPLDDRPRNDSGLIDFYWKYSSDELMPLIQEIANVCGNMVIAQSSSDELVFVYPNSTE
ncbi:MAG: hypothetical protein ABI700_18845 [Chloroflexota bacterium]